MSSEPLRLLALEATNFLGLRVVELEIGPDGLVVSGDNGSGKTSVLRILDAAFGGAKGEPDVPIHAGTFRAEIAVVVGRDGKPAYRIEKVWVSGKPSKLIVTDASGATCASPQKILDGLFDAMSFDPGAFIRPPGAKTADAVAAEQLRILLGVCPLDIDLAAVAKRRKLLYDERTALNRDVDSLTGRLEALGAKPKVPEAVDLADLRSQFTKGAQTNSLIESGRSRLQAIGARLAELKAEADRLVAEDAEIRQRLGAAQKVDLSAVSDAITRGEGQNVERERAIAACARYDELLQQLGRGRRGVEERTAAIEGLDREKVEALARAKFPAPELSVDAERGVLVRLESGDLVPFAQVNGQNQMRLAVLICAAGKAPVRAAVIRDGNAFDAKQIRAFVAQCHELGVQPIIERIAADVPGSVVMEAGEVARVVPKEEVAP